MVQTAPIEATASSTPRPAGLRSPGWAAAVVLAATGAVLRAYGVSLPAFLTFCAYVGLGIALPGTLLWRLAHRRAGALMVDLGPGLALGYGLEILAYVPARALGAPLAATALPAAVVVAFLAVRPLRRYFRRDRAAPRPPLAHAWLLAAIALVLLFWSTVFFRHHGFGWPSYGKPDIDVPFHLALVGELKHHMGLVTPWVVSEPVYYHWFVYADMAATSWATGIEPYVLLTRLSMLPVIYGSVLACYALGRQVAGSWRAGAVTVVAAFLVLAPDPYGWVQDLFYRDYGFNPVDDGSNVRLTLWSSPTQTFGALLFAPLMLVVLDVLRGSTEDGAGGPDRRLWALAAVLPAAVMGAKASFLPTLAAALLLVLAVHGVRRRRLHRRAAIALGIVAGWLVFAQIVLFGGQSQGLGLAPLDALRRNAAGVTTHYTEHPQPYRLLVLLALTLLGWAMVWGGAAGLRGRLLRPDAVLLAGLGGAGAAVLLLFGHSGGSAEGFFLQGARPYLAALAAWGLLAWPGRPERRGTTAAAFAAGTALTLLVRLVDGGEVPIIGPDRRAVAVTVALGWPWAVLAAAAIGVLVLARRRALGAGLVAVFLLGCTAPTIGRQLAYAYTDGRDNGWSERADLWPVVTEGTLEAGRWLRAHSSPDDLVATNAHCAYEGRRGRSACDRRHFGIAAFAERRVLVEGWAYTAEAHNQERRQGVPQEHTAYWRPAVLADNDAAFADPSPATIGVLRERYGVRWLVTEDDIVAPSPLLPRVATLVFRSGPSAVWRI